MVQGTFPVKGIFGGQKSVSGLVWNIKKRLTISKIKKAEKGKNLKCLQE